MSLAERAWVARQVWYALAFAVTDLALLGLVASDGGAAGTEVAREAPVIFEPIGGSTMATKERREWYQIRWLSRLVWLLRQLLPFTYRTRYGDAAGQHYTVWRMWFGRCFGIDDVLVEPTPQEAPPRGLIET